MTSIPTDNPRPSAVSEAMIEAGCLENDDWGKTERRGPDFVSAIFRAMEAARPLADDWRCVNCKLVVSSPNALPSALPSRPLPDDMAGLVSDVRNSGWVSQNTCEKSDLPYRLADALETALQHKEEAERERDELRVGDAVECVIENMDARWRDDWAEWSGFLAGISVGPSGAANYIVSDHWPPKSNGDLTDGFAANELRKVQPL